MDNNSSSPTSTIEKCVNNIKQDALELVGRATEIASSVGVPERETRDLVHQTLQQGEYTGSNSESFSSRR